MCGGRAAGQASQAQQSFMGSARPALLPQQGPAPPGRSGPGPMIVPRPPHRWDRLDFSYPVVGPSMAGQWPRLPLLGHASAKCQAAFRV